jgi:maleylpyruvate isomerase
MISWSATALPSAVSSIGLKGVIFEQVFVILAGWYNATLRGLMGSMESPVALPRLDETVLATTRYLQALTELADEDVRGPSLLPGWSRAHVITHLARHADALTHALHGVLNGADAWMYSSQDARNADIEAGSRRGATELREDAAASWGRLLQTLNELHPAQLDVAVSRLPDGPRFLTVRTVPQVRWTEVEVHHADLDIGYTAADWPADLALLLIGRRVDELGLDGPSMVLSGTDVDGLWKTGSGAGPEIRGPARALAWWLIGRGEGAGLVSSTGELPRLGNWR